MIILGIGDVTHDASDYVLKDTQILAAIETERLSRVKHGLKPDPKKYTLTEQAQDFTQQLPSRSAREAIHLRNIDYCLTAAHLKRTAIDHVFISSLFQDSIFSTPSPLDGIIHLLPTSHHKIHAASSFYTSPFESAAILAIDGYGTLNANQYSDSILFARGEKNSLHSLKTIQGKMQQTEEEKALGIEAGHMVFSDSLGVFYQNITLLLGFGYFNEGKVMGLSAYGKANPHYASIQDWIQFHPEGGLSIQNREIFLLVQSWMDEIRTRISDPQLQFQAFADLAFIHQTLLEKMIFHLCQALHHETGETRLCLAGGVALNSVANGKIQANTPFTEIHLIPPTGDNGIGLGAALYGAHQALNLPRKLLKKFSPYLGKIYSSADIHRALEPHPSLKRLSNPKNLSGEMLAATLLAQGKVIAWFNGATEIGPRALGNRSLLADPRSKTIRDHLNFKVKHREFFRPFAPACLAEDFETYFSAGSAGGTPFMLEIRYATPLALQDIPAVIHVDESARVQIIDPETNPQFDALVRAFKKITGIGVILNTSLNGPKEPIVETPEEAIQCFLNYPIDALFLNGEGFVKTF